MKKFFNNVAEKIDPLILKAATMAHSNESEKCTKEATKQLNTLAEKISESKKQWDRILASDDLSTNKDSITGELSAIDHKLAELTAIVQQIDDVHTKIVERANDGTSSATNAKEDCNALLKTQKELFDTSFTPALNTLTSTVGLNVQAREKLETDAVKSKAATFARMAP